MKLSVTNLLTAALAITLTSASSASTPTGSTCGSACDAFLINLKNEYNLNPCAEKPGTSCPAPFGNSGNSGPATVFNNVCNDSQNDIQICYQCSTDGSGSGETGTNAQLVAAYMSVCTTYFANGQSAQAAYNCWLSLSSGGGSCSSISASSPQAGNTAERFALNGEMMALAVAAALLVL